MRSNLGREVQHFKTKDGRDASIRYLSWDDVRPMQHFVNTVSKEDTYILLSGEQFSFEQEADFVSKQLVQIEKRDCVYLLCFIQGDLVGTFSATRNIHARRREQHVANLGLIVSKDVRNQGVGKKLMEIGLIEVKNQLEGIKIVTLGVFSNNTIAHRLYLNLGFKHYGRIVGGVKHGNSYVDHIYMYKRL